MSKTSKQNLVWLRAVMGIVAVAAVVGFVLKSKKKKVEEPNKVTSSEDSSPRETDRTDPQATEQDELQIDKKIQEYEVKVGVKEKVSPSPAKTKENE